MTKKEKEAAAARARLAEKDPAVLERKVEEARRQRREYEMGMLQEEKRKYNLKRIGKPISEMIA